MPESSDPAGAGVALSPPPTDALAVLLRGGCTFSWLFAAGFTAFALLWTVQDLLGSIPAGTIERVEHAKAGKTIIMTDGVERHFPSSVLNDGPEPIELRPGDRVEKRRGSFVYVLNGRRVADGWWFVRTQLAPVHLRVFVCVYLTLGFAYAVRYRRSTMDDVPVWEGRRSGDPPPMRPTLSRPRAVFGVVRSWVVGAVVLACLWQGMACCAFAVAWPFLHRG